MYKTIVTWVTCTLVCSCLVSFQAEARTASDHILVQGAPLVGGTNGMFFDAADRLYVASVVGQSISILDPDTGEIVDRLGPEVGVFFPDDLTFLADGTLVWTDPVFGLVNSLSPSGVPATLVAGFPNANPITVSDSNQLFFAQCFGDLTGIFEVDLTGATDPRVIREGDPDCASNGMDWWDGALYSPRWFEERVVRVDVGTGDIEEVTTGLFIPTAAKFDSQGRLHAISQGSGEVVRIDLATGDRTLLAQLPTGLDNLAFDSNDRLFVSGDGVVEVLEDGSTRTVSPGGLSIPLGIALLNGTVYVSELATIRSFDADDGQPIGVTESVFSVGPLTVIPLNVAAFGQDLLLLDIFNNAAAIWDPAAETEALIDPFALPVDAEPFQGGMAVTELGTGSVVLASGPNLSDRETLFSGLVVPAGLAADGGDLYVSDLGQGMVFQIVDDGEVLPAPRPVTAEHFSMPEGIAIRSKYKLVVVEGGTGMLKEINLVTGRVRTIAEGLSFMPPLPGFFPFQFFNDAEVDSTGAVYVNGDGAAVIYKFAPPFRGLTISSTRAGGIRNKAAKLLEDGPLGNYPNPFNSQTTIRFAIPLAGELNLSIYNSTGQKVTDLVSEPRPAGVHTVHWDGTSGQGEDVASGMYFYRIQARQHVEMRKLLLLR